MKWTKRLFELMGLVEVSAATLADKRDLIISNASIEEIENGFRKNTFYTSDMKELNLENYKDIFK